MDNKRLRAFNRMTAAFSPTVVAKMMNRLTPSMDWRRSSKKAMAEAFAKGNYGLDDLDIADMRHALITILNREYGFDL